MPTPKYIFTAVDDQLRVELDNSSFQWENDDVSNYREASVSFFDFKKIYLYDFGKPQKQFIFENFGTIGGVAPVDIEEAFNLLSALIPENSSEPGGGIPEAPEDGKTYGRKDANWAEVVPGDLDISGTQRQIIGFDENGNPVVVTLGWKQLSDLPVPPTFSNGVYVGTAFQPDGSALFAFIELAIDSPNSLAKPNAIPIYQAGTIGTGGGTLPVQDPVEDLDAVNKKYFEENVGITVDTAFVTKSYSATMSVAHNSEQPNFNINLTGNLDLTITGTVNGDSGIINLYFSGTEVATLNGFADLVINGNGAMIPVWFIHDLDGLKWDNGDFDLSDLAKSQGTVLYHVKTALTTGTISNVGNAVTGVGTNFDTPYNFIGSIIKKSNGETAIIDTITDNENITTVEPFKTDSVNTGFTLQAVATRIKDNGDIDYYDSKEGNLRFSIKAEGDVVANALTARSNGVTSIGSLLQLGANSYVSDVLLRINIPSYSSESEALADVTLESNSQFRVTGDLNIKIKP